MNIDIAKLKEIAEAAIHVEPCNDVNCNHWYFYRVYLEEFSPRLIMKLLNNYGRMEKTLQKVYFGPGNNMEG